MSYACETKQQQQQQQQQNKNIIFYHIILSQPNFHMVLLELTWVQ